MPKLLHKAKTVFIFSVAFLLFAVQPAFSQHDGHLEKRTVKVAYFFGEGFQEVSPIDGHRFGYGYEYLQKLSYFSGWKYEYIDTNWADAVRMIEDGTADILAEVSKTPEREKKMLFADHAMGTEEYYLYVHQNEDEIKLENLDSLTGKLVGINAGSYQLEVFRKWVSENNVKCKIVEYADEEVRNLDFVEGRLDAAVDYDFYLEQGWVPLVSIGNSNYYIAVTPSKKDLLDELNDAQSKLFESSPLFIDHLKTIYFPHEIISKSLNKREIDWVKNHEEKHGKIKIGYTDNYLPYCSQNKTTGELEGALSVYLKNLEDVFGVETEPVVYTNWESLYKAVQENEICACFPVYNMLWQTEELGFMQTDSIIDFPVAFVFRKGEYNGMENVKNFGVPKTSQMHTAYIRDKYPGSNIVFYGDYPQTLRAISNGEVEGMFINTFILARLYDDYEQNKNLDISYMTNDARLSIGVSASSPELLTILNKNTLLIDTSVLTSSLVHNSQMEKSYSWKRFIREYSVFIIIFVLLFCAFIVAFMKHQISQIRIAKQQADSAKLDAEELNLELEAALKRERDSQRAVHEAFESATKANAAKTEFLASMSHDIRTPMNAIIGMTALAAANMEDKEKVQYCLSEITVSSKHLLNLINEVLDMNKIESGKISLNESHFNFADLIDEFVSISKPLVKDKNQEFTVNIHDIKHEDVIGDAGRIQQCLMNFMSNAVKYTPEGGKIKLSITEKITNKPKIGCFEFILEDNGIGMDEKFVKVMFDPFTRAEDKRAQKQQGTGLGLPITRNIIRMMNGDIKVKSELDKGTKITATIFLELQDSDEKLNLASLADLPVLVADDDKASCESTCFLLRELGMDSEGVYGGKKAVERVIQRHKDGDDFFAIIVDWKMPDMDGVETSRAIREAVGKDVPIIIVSAYDWADIENEAREAGVNTFIAKPIFKSKVAHTFLELTGKERAENNQIVLEKFRDENFKGMKVLLAEDNKINAEIAKEILEMTGLSVDVVLNGKEAVEKLSESDDDFYKLVFMDIQMPIMDGYEATQKIRESDRKYLKNIPIVAMSANAFAEDVQKSVSVGMNDHIAKPLDFDRLLSVLNRWVKK